MKVKNRYPEWAEKFRGPGRTIRKTKSGYALYRCTSRYVKGGHPKSVQEYLGRITEQDGFIPKAVHPKHPSFMEYGLSEFIYRNFGREISRMSYQMNDDLLRVSIVSYVFGSASLFFLKKCYLTHDDALKLYEYSRNISSRRIITAKKNIDRILRRELPDDDERLMVTEGLRLCVMEEGLSLIPALPSEIKTIFERNSYRYGKD